MRVFAYCLISDALQELQFDFAEEKSILSTIISLVGPPEDITVSHFWMN